MTIVKMMMLVVCYLIGSIPVAVSIGKRHRIDPRTEGDKNPGYWNTAQLLGKRAALPVFIADTIKGVAAGSIGDLLPGPWWFAYLAVGAAMIGHAWPVFSQFRGGRSILTFTGGVIVLTPIPTSIAIVLLLLTTAATRSFAKGARVGMFTLPIIQLFFLPRTHVAVTGILMSFIGFRFLQAHKASGGVAA
jgi:acyl phosphate:glycerol-3-phosphate acyltransferase